MTRPRSWSAHSRNILLAGVWAPNCLTWRNQTLDAHGEPNCHMLYSTTVRSSPFGRPAVTNLDLPLIGRLAWIDMVVLAWFAITALSVI